MLVVFVLLVLALLVKDATLLGDCYVFRASLEGMALLVGCAWITTSGIRKITWWHMILGF